MIALNIDLGEHPDEPEELYELADIVNIAAGGHAGDHDSMRRAVELAKRAGAGVAVHPSYPDRASFGRKSMSMSTQALVASVQSQCKALLSLTGVPGIYGIKPHGALYHDAARNRAIADAVVEGFEAAYFERINLKGPPTVKSPTLIGPPEGELVGAAKARLLHYEREGFADRGYRSDGTLVPRTEPGALLLDPRACADQAVRLAASGTIDTLCIHSDTPGAVANARAVRRALEGAGLIEAK